MIEHLFPYMLMHFANLHWFVRLDRFEKFDLYSLLVLWHSTFRQLMTQKCPKFIGDGSVPSFGIFCCCCTRETVPSIICKVIEFAGIAIRTYSRSHRCITNGRLYVNIHSFGCAPMSLRSAEYIADKYFICLQ